jgi:uncharacterized membrane protein YdbT with pleckstrin-like domain
VPAVIGLAGILLFRRLSNSTGTIASLLSFGLIIISIPFILRFVTTWMGRVYIVTDRRVVMRDGIMSQDLEQVALINIEQVNVERPNPIALLCGLGTVGVKPGGRELKLRGISKPRDLADLILLLRWEATVRSFEMPERPEVRNQLLKQALDTADPPAPDVLFPPPRRPPMNGLLHRRLPIWLSPPESVVEVVYRHWIVLVARELVALGLIAVTVVACLGLHTLAPGSGTKVVLVALGGALLTLAYAVVSYIDWADDVFILTTHRVVDIDRIFLILAAYSKEIPLGQVQDVLVDYGFFGQIFGYGTIRVEIAGGKVPVTMRHVPDPRSLMHRIFAQVESKRRRDNSFEREKRRAEVYQIMAHVLDTMLIQVPDLAGLTVLAAATRARSAGFQLTVSGERPAPGIPSGTVLEQTPPAGRMSLAEEGVQVILSGRNPVQLTPPPSGTQLTPRP